ncbi:hypothetical protein [Vibrio parahaemolyticus]|uniref:hypothetical protein n=1 Tax=Vibrio parahaemolyticus TaxID=670 RepID=UPI0005B70957|nr:hypothetical protein [Vibrio parahaemolyticus]KIT49484.1 hypothetical protein H331_01680 [Vibrio parahaemolyticus 3644]EGR0532128.1 hypothetical protein [Vibrio parahaemolyticus]EGR0653204.1 hypothetical protein [Vibrio parahaemolyticus]EGR0699693.1 hypothetical protein [Vibrio parahaemolyticus]EGR0885020.1 hypothetical protein [Vibrio parahaemolyticus]
MNVQIHPSYFHKIVSSEPFSLMLDVAAATGYLSHHVYVCLSVARAAKLPKECVNLVVEEEINHRRSMLRSARFAGGEV